MRLSDRDIIGRLATANIDKRLVITPLLFPGGQIGASSIDVHLGTEFCILDTSSIGCFNPLMSREEFLKLIRNSKKIKRLSPMKPFFLHPQELVLASTLEWIKVPSDLTAKIDGRSSWARLGLKVHSTAGDVQPGSYGVVVFELQTDGVVPFEMYPGMSIAQLSFEYMHSEPIEPYKKPRARLQGQLSPSVGKYPDDEELKIIRRLASSKTVN